MGKGVIMKTVTLGRYKIYYAEDGFYSVDIVRLKKYHLLDLAYRFSLLYGKKPLQQPKPVKIHFTKY
jgi:hypothetical protein